MNFNIFQTKWTEQQRRSVSKVITWRLLVTFSNTLAGFVASGSWTVGLGVAAVALVINSVLYWFHERAWNVTDWGKQLAEKEQN